jgi:glutamate-1-semialdehyde 2,1-aminomutase
MRSTAASEQLGARAHQLMPGQHSNLPGYELFGPLWIERGDAAHVWDVDGNEYIDYMCGMGAGTLGYGVAPVLDAIRDQLYRLQYLDTARRHPAEIELAEKIVRHVPSAEKVRYLLSGTEAVQLAIRLARAYTKRNLFIRFDGHYHGWMDNVYGGGVDPAPDGPPYALYRDDDLFTSRGLDPDTRRQSFKLPWNDIEVLERTLERYGDQVALVLMEAINANGGSCHPRPGYLERVRDLCDRYGIVLCFDEIITGFRVDIGGAQRLLGVTPDLTTLGKGLAGGAPLSAVCGKAEIMDLCERRTVVSAGTFNGYPLGVAAAIATLCHLEQDDGAYFRRVAATQAPLVAGLREIAARHGRPMLVQDCPGVVMFYPAEVERAWTIGDWYPIADHALGDRIRREMADDGVLTMFRGRWYVSGSLTCADVDRTLEVVDGVFARL